MQTTFICPATGAELQFELPADEPARKVLWNHAFEVKCPVCEGLHEVSYREAYVSAAMSEFACLPTDLKTGRLQ
jgi:hypothetical protein